MIFPILLSVIISGAATPAPASPGDAPLKEIGHVISTSGSCGALVVHANGAISATLNDDLLLGRTIGRLRASDLEDSPMRRQAALNDLDRLAGEIRQGYLQGDGEVKRLRDMAAKSSDPTQKVELRTFADALGGALNRQRKMMADLNGMVAYLGFQDMKTESDTDNQMMASQRIEFNGPAQQAQMLATGQQQGVIFDHGSPNQILLNAAADFQSRMGDIQLDEAKAANHIDGALSGC